MSPSQRRLRQLLESIWTMLLSADGTSIQTRFLDDYIDPQAKPTTASFAIQSFVASMSHKHVKRSLDMTMDQLESRWLEVRLPVREGLLELGRTHHYGRITKLIPLTPDEKAVLRIRWELADLKFKESRTEIVERTKELGFDLDQSKFLRGALSIGEQLRELPRIVAEVATARIVWDCAAAMHAGVAGRKDVRGEILGRAQEAGQEALDAFGSGLHRLRHEDGVPSIAAIEQALEPAREALKESVGANVKTSPTPAQAEAFGLLADRMPPVAPSRSEDPYPANPIVRFLNREREQRGVLWTVVGTLFGLILAALGLGN